MQIILLYILHNGQSRWWKCEKRGGNYVSENMFMNFWTIDHIIVLNCSLFLLCWLIIVCRLHWLQSLILHNHRTLANETWTNGMFATSKQTFKRLCEVPPAILFLYPVLREGHVPESSVLWGSKLWIYILQDWCKTASENKIIANTGDTKK